MTGGTRAAHAGSCGSRRPGLSPAAKPMPASVMAPAAAQTAPAACAARWSRLASPSRSTSGPLWVWMAVTMISPVVMPVMACAFSRIAAQTDRLRPRTSQTTSASVRSPLSGTSAFAYSSSSTPVDDEVLSRYPDSRTPTGGVMTISDIPARSFFIAPPVSRVCRACRSSSRAAGKGRGAGRGRWRGAAARGGCGARWVARGGVLGATDQGRPRAAIHAKDVEMYRAKRSLGKEDAHRLKPFVATLLESQSNPVKPGQQPEASLA